MRKLNLVLMVVLTLGVIGGAAYLSMGGPPSDDGEERRIQYLLRKLADLDPEIRSEAEASFREMGPEAVPVLREAAASDDARLVRRARKLLRELDPTPVVRKPVRDSKVEAAVEPDEAAANVRFVLECPEPELGSLRDARFYVRLVNEGPVPVLLVKFGEEGFGRIGGFEIVDAQENVVFAACEFPAELHPLVKRPQLLDVAPGETFDLFAGQADGRAGLFFTGEPRDATGPVRVRFYYEAGKGAGYPEAVAGATEGSPLPPTRLYSNVVTLTIAD